MLQKYGNLKLRSFEILVMYDNVFWASRMEPGSTLTYINVLCPPSAAPILYCHMTLGSQTVYS